MEYKKLVNELYAALPKLTHHQIKEIKRIVHKQFLKRFARSAPPKYGSLNKGFTEEEVQLFFKTIDNQKLLLLFSYQAQLGLRVGEAVRLNIRDIDFKTRELTIKSEKSNTIDTLLIPMPLLKLTLEHIRQFSAQVEVANGYLFFKEEGKYSERNEQYLSKNYVRNRFRYYVQQADLDKVYDQSDETIYGRTPRRLHRLTTHSLRHYAITHFAEQTNGNVFLASKFARHRQLNVTMTYISTNKKQLYDGIDSAFSASQAQTLKSRLLSKQL